MRALCHRLPVAAWPCGGHALYCGVVLWGIFHANSVGVDCCVPFGSGRTRFFVVVCFCT